MKKILVFTCLSISLIENNTYNKIQKISGTGYRNKSFYNWDF